MIIRNKRTSVFMSNAGLFVIIWMAMVGYVFAESNNDKPGNKSITFTNLGTQSRNTSIKSTAFMKEPSTLELSTDQKLLYWDYIKNAADAYDLEPNLIVSVIRVESNFKKTAKSKKGAQGLMQLMPRTADLLGVKDAFDPEENINGGSKYLRMMIDEFNDLRHALAAYNAGPEAVRKYSGIPPYSETKNYVESVMSLYKGPFNISGEYLVQTSMSGKLTFTNLSR